MICALLWRSDFVKHTRFGYIEDMAKKKNTTKTKAKAKAKDPTKLPPNTKGYRSKKHLENPGGQPKHRVTAERRNLVKLYAVGGVDQRIIADIIGITAKTLRKYYRAELDTSKDIANAEITGLIFQQAKQGCRKSQALWVRMQQWVAGQKINITQTNIDASKVVDKPFETIEEASEFYRSFMEGLETPKEPADSDTMH